MIHLGYPPTPGRGFRVAILLAASFIVAVSALGVAAYAVSRAEICEVRHDG